MASSGSTGSLLPASDIRKYVCGEEGMGKGQTIGPVGMASLRQLSAEDQSKLLSSYAGKIPSTWPTTIKKQDVQSSTDRCDQVEFNVRPISLYEADAEACLQQDSGTETESGSDDDEKESEVPSEEIFSTKSPGEVLKINEKENSPFDQAIKEAILKAPIQGSRSSASSIHEQETAKLLETAGKAEKENPLFSAINNQKVPHTVSCPFPPCCDRGRSMALLAILDRRRSYRPVSCAAAGMDGMSSGDHKSASGVHDVQHPDNIRICGNSNSNELPNCIGVQ